MTLDVRFPNVDPDGMTDLQRRFVSDLAAGPRGMVSGPFLPLVHAPELGRRIEKMGRHLRFESKLPKDIIELAILMTAHEWSCHYEWHFHARLAVQAGMAATAIEAIRHGRQPDGLTPEQALVYRYCQDVYAKKEVGDANFQSVKDRFGTEGALELLALCGYYSTLAMILNTARLMPAEGPAF